MTTPSSELSIDFLRLPSVVTDKIYALLLPQSKALWVRNEIFYPYYAARDPVMCYRRSLEQELCMHKRAHHSAAIINWAVGGLEATDVDRQLGPGSSEGYRRVYAQQRAHNAIRLSRLPPEIREKLRPHLEAIEAKEERARAQKALRLVCRSIRDDVDQWLFRRTELWFKLGRVEVAFFKAFRNGLLLAKEPPVLFELPGKESCLPQASIDEDVAEGAERPSQDAWETFLATRQSQDVIKWIARFRDVHIMLHEEHLPELDMVLGGIQAHREGSIRPELHIVVCGFKEYFHRFYTHHELYDDHGDGKLPSSILKLASDGTNPAEHVWIKKSDEISTSSKCTFTGVSQGSTDLFCNPNPPPLRSELKTDYIYYNISFSMAVRIKTKIEVNGDGSNSAAAVHEEVDLTINGNYIHHAQRGTMQNIVGWEPKEPALY